MEEEAGCLDAARLAAADVASLRGLLRVPRLPLEEERAALLREVPPPALAPAAPHCRTGSPAPVAAEPQLTPPSRLSCPAQQSVAHWAVFVCSATC